MDLVIVSLVHQGPEMVYWMAKNIQKYVTGNFVWVVHYNGAEPLDTNKLPSWAWSVPSPIVTYGYTPRIARAVAMCIDYARSRTQFTNVLTMSSGSAFFRPYTVPNEERVQFATYDPLFHPNGLRYHNEPISVSELGRCGPYIEALGHPQKWQFEGFDAHSEIHERIRARGFEWIVGTQWSGQLIPYTPAIQFADDMLSTPLNGPPYAAEEILMSTYSYNYALRKPLPLWHSEAIIQWGPRYMITEYTRVETYRNLCTVFPGMGHLVCKVPDDLTHPVRVFLTV